MIKRLLPQKSITLYFVGSIFFLLPSVFLFYFSGCSFSDPSHAQAPIAPSEQGLTVLSATPQGLIEDVNQFYSVVVVFNQPMVPLEALPEGDGSGPLTITPALKGKYRWMGTNTLVFTPADVLTLSSRYQVTIPAGTKSLSGSLLSAPYHFSFETMRPRFLHSNIYDDAKGVTISPKIYLLFNQNILLSNAKEKISLSNELSGRAVECVVRLADSNEAKDYVQNYNYEYANSAIAKLEKRLLIVIPLDQLSMLTPYTITIKEGLKGEVGSLASRESKAISFTTYGTLELVRFSSPVSPSQPVKIKLTNRVDYEALRNHITISPEAEIKYLYDTYWDEEYSTIIYIDLKPRTHYEMRFDKNITDDFGNDLGVDIVHEFETGDYEPGVFFQSGEHIIESYLSHSFNVPVLNPKYVNVRLALLSENDLISVLNQGLWKRDLIFDKWGSSRSEKPDVPLNQQGIYPVDLDEVLGGGRNGNILIEFKHGSEAYAQRAIAQVTAIGISAKFSRLNNLVYLTYLEDGRPVGSAAVEIRDDTGNIAWMGRTDEKGFVKTPGWEALGLRSRNEWSEPRQWVFVSKAGQKAYINSDKNVELYRFNIPTNWRVSDADRLSATLFTNQGMYRPGDKVLFKGITRKLQQDSWSVSSGRRVTVSVVNPSSEEIFTKNCTTNTMGAFDFEYDLDVNAPLGYYSVKAYDGKEEVSTESFQVQEFRPVETEVTIRTKKDEYVWGEKLEASLDAHYLFGAPMSHAEIKWSVSRSKSSFVPDGYDDYYFGAISDDYYGYRGSYATVLSSKTEQLNERGLLDVSLSLNNSVGESSTLVIEGDVRDKNRQEVSGRKSVTVHAGKYYIGLKPTTTFHTLGDKLHVDLITVDPKGRKLRGNLVRLELIRREWISVREKTGEGTFQWNSQVKDTLESSFEAVSAAQPISQSLRPQSTGYYIIKATGSDDLRNKIVSSCFVYVTGEGYTGWNLRDDDAIDLVADKKSYNPGETAKILVKSPYEKCKALITVEREGILSHKAVDLNGNASFIEIPVTADLIPNAYVSVILLQGRTALPTADKFEDLGKPAFKIGYTKLSINSDANKLNVALKLNKEKFAPNEWVNLELDIRDNGGQGKISEVTLYVEDIGVLNLVNYKTPDPFSYFYQHRELGVTTSESRKYVLDQIVNASLKDKGGVGGGGGDDMFAAVSVRKNFKACVYWNPSIMTDAYGKAKIRFQLPENVTGFKIIAVAHSADSKFGSADKNITVSKELMMRAALPRFARVGDEVEAGVIVHNYSDKDGAVKLFTEMDGVELKDLPAKDIFLNRGASQEVRYKFNVRDNKAGKFTFKAVMNDLTDGVEVSIPLKIPTYTETVALYGSTTETHKEEIKIPKNIYEDFGGLSVKTASTALVDLDGSIKYLFEYPYGCLEQKTSRALPIILFGDVVEAFKLDAFPDKAKNVDDVIREYLDDVPKFQQYSGGFSYWTGGEYVSPYVSVYTMFALTHAKAKGFEVNQECYAKGLEYLKSMVRQSAAIDRYGLFYWHTTHAFALATLAENGYYDASSVELLFQRRDEMPLYARAMLLKAVVKGKGNRAIAEELRRNLLNAIKMNPTTAHFEEPFNTGLEWTFHSNIRTTSAILQVFLEMDKEDVPWAEKTVKYLLQDRKDGRWRTTQENVYVFWALGSYFRIFEKEIPDFKSQVQIDGKQILSEIYKGRSTATHTSNIKFNQLQKDVSLPMDFNFSGTGRLYYNVRMTYAPKSGIKIKSRDEGMKITKSFFDEKGKAVTNGKFTAGAMYRIELNVSSAQDRQFVVVDDPLPAGFEAVNVNLATSNSSAKAIAGPGSRGGWWSYGTFNHSEMRDDRVLVFADWMPQGKHTFTYLARATTFGRFELPSTKAEEMYSPEIFGNTSNLTVIVE